MTPTPKAGDKPTQLLLGVGAPGGAEVSPCGRYRYWLWRRWAPPRGEGRDRVLFVMLNPSTADAGVDDPTLRRCIAFARAWGFGSLEVVNLFALRSPDPDRLLRGGAADPEAIGPDNDTHLVVAANRADVLVVAWGAHPAAAARRDAVLELLRGRPLHCLGTTRGGEPRHPLYVRGDVRPRVWAEHEG